MVRGHACGRHRHADADSPEPGLRHAGWPATAGWPLCEHASPACLCGVRQQPHTGCRAGGGDVVDDRRSHRTGCGGGLRRLLGGRACAGFAVWPDADPHGRAAAWLVGELPQSPGHIRLHLGVRRADRLEPGQARAGDCGIGRYPAGTASRAMARSAPDQWPYRGAGAVGALVPVVVAQRAQAMAAPHRHRAALGRCPRQGGTRGSNRGDHSRSLGLGLGRARRACGRGGATGTSPVHASHVEPGPVDGTGRASAVAQRGRLR